MKKHDINLSTLLPQVWGVTYFDYSSGNHMLVDGTLTRTRRASIICAVGRNIELSSETISKRWKFLYREGYRAKKLSIEFPMS